MMPRHRSKKRPLSRAVAATAVAITETLEGRCLLSGGGPGGLPLSLLPYLYMGPVFRFSQPAPRVAPAKPTGLASVSRSQAAAPRLSTASIPPVVAAQTEADRPSI